jgi:hypothetical protein
MCVCTTRTRSFSNNTEWLPGAATNASRESGHGQVSLGVPESSELIAHSPWLLFVAGIEISFIENRMKENFQLHHNWRSDN